MINFVTAHELKWVPPWNPRVNRFQLLCVYTHHHAEKLTDWPFPSRQIKVVGVKVDRSLEASQHTRGESSRSPPARNHTSLTPENLDAH